MIPHKASTTVELEVLGLVADETTAVRLAVPALVMTVESSIATVRARRTEHTLDRAGCLVAARGDRLVLRASGAASRVAVLGLHERVIDAAEAEYRKLGFDRRRFERSLRQLSLLPRTVWVHELVHRYLFERHALGERDNAAIRFLEVEIVKELYFLFRDRDAGEERATIVRTYSAAVERALRHIETHLFDDCTVAVLARQAGASASTLLRLFRTEVGCSPGAYWRNRKLDEALIALRGGRSVTEVAARVGYENPTAFGFAFRRRFGRPPSAFRPKGRVRRAP